MTSSITKEMVNEAQANWGAGIVEDRRRLHGKVDYTETARNHIATLYAYDQSPVLFKPTKAAAEQFRSTKESALLLLCRNKWSLRRGQRICNSTLDKSSF